MVGFNQANIMVKVSELSEITTQEIKAALEEKKVGAGKELYFILCDQQMAPEAVATEAELKEYADNIIAKLEEVTGKSYTDAEKEAATEFFILNRIRYGSSIDQTVARSLSIIENYKTSEKGTFVWFIVETVKRQLIGTYVKDTKYLQELKEMIADVKKTSDQYDLYAAEL